MIPADTVKPADLRKRGEKLPEESLLSDLDQLIALTTVPMPFDNPDAILDTVSDRRLQLQYEGELAYLRGDFEKTIRCFNETKGDDAARLRACPVAIAAAISLGDYRAYTEIEAYLKGWAQSDKRSHICAMAELSLATAAVSVIAPNMAPGWLKEGDFSTLPVQAKPNALYLRAKYFHCMSKNEVTLALAQTALALYASDKEVTMTHIYLRLMCAVACHVLDREDEARQWLSDAMHIALPHGFITPFAESITALGGLVEQCLEQMYPESYNAVIGQWERTWKNWITFHNQFAKDNITMILSLREYHIALLAARRVPYAKIADHYHISVGRVKNIMLEVYEKLCISGRDELSKYIL
jgi:DNA-binding CsgD family transcriptional regulator